MLKFRSVPGINIQWPWSELIVSGKKSVETRSYPIPAKYVGVELAIIETPGANGKRAAGISTARIVGTVVFSSCYPYRSLSHWEREVDLHRVDKSDPHFAYTSGKPRWAWVVGRVDRITHPIKPPAKRGIIFAKECKLPLVCY